MIRDKGSFEFGGINSEEFNIILTEPPQIIFAEKDVENISVSGRSGDLTADKGRYKNVTIPYKCAFIPKAPQGLRELAISAIFLLKPSGGYQRLVNSFQPDYYRMARISNQITVESLVEEAGRFTVEFVCKPQRFLVDGDRPIRFTAPSVLVNQTLFNAKPLIVVYGNGPGTVTVGNKTVEVKALDDQIILDCETENAYRQVGEGAPENKNSSIYAPEFPELVPGKNVVSWTGGITSVEVTPRWWTL